MIQHTKSPNVFSFKTPASVPSVKQIFIFYIQQAQPDHIPSSKKDLQIQYSKLPAISITSKLSEEIIPNYIFDSASPMEPNITAMSALAHTYRIELVSTLVLCAHLCALFLWWRRSFSSKKQRPTPCDPMHAGCIFCYGVPEEKAVGAGESRIPDCDDDHCNCVCCYGIPEKKTVGVGESRTPDCDPMHAGCMFCYGVPEEKAVGEGELRRSERVRTPTKRFEESWYAGKLQSLGDALSSDEE